MGSLLRFFGITLAAVELILLSMKGFGLQFSVPDFAHFLRMLGDSLSTFFAPVEAIIRDLLAILNVQLPKLGEHWHHVFVLSWLFCGSWARMLASDSFKFDTPILSGPWLGNAVGTLLVLTWAALCALIAAVPTGLQPPNSMAVPFWMIVGLCLFQTGTFVPAGFAGRYSWREVRTASAPTALIAGLAAAVGYFVASPTLLIVIVIVGVFGLIIGLGGLFARENTTWRERLTNPFTGFGMDIIGAYAIAFGLAWFFGGYLPS